MKTTLLIVTSLDGRSTKGNSGDHSWISSQDQEHFKFFIEEHTLLIMGRNTYEAAKFSMKHTPGRKRVIITRHPEKYRHEEIPGMLEFTDEPLLKLFKRLSKDFSQGILLSGASLNSELFRLGLVNEIVITIEPKLLGKGNGIVDFEEHDITLELKSIEKLNHQGTLLLKYLVK